MGIFDKLFGSGKTKSTSENQYLNESQLQTGYAAAEDALRAAQAQGTYQGDTYAGLNQTQLDAINRTTGRADAAQGDIALMGEAGRAALAAGSGYGANAQGIFDRLPGMFESGRDRALSAATGDRADALVDAANRDAVRGLTEDVLPGIRVGITGTGNRNSSRAGAAEAIAARATQDRMADTGATIRNTLYSDEMDRAYREAMGEGQLSLQANAQLGTAMDRGYQGLLAAPGLAGMYDNAALAGGTLLQQDAQNRLTDAAARYDLDRMDGLNLVGQYMGAMGGPVLKSTETENDSGAGIFQRFGEGMAGLKKGLSGAADVASMFM